MELGRFYFVTRTRDNVKIHNGGIFRQDIDYSPKILQAYSLDDLVTQIIKEIEEMFNEDNTGEN